MKPEWRDTDPYFRWTRQTYKLASFTVVFATSFIVFTWPRMDGYWEEHALRTFGLDGVE